MIKLNFRWLAVGALVVASVAAMAQDGGGRRQRGGGQGGFQRGGQQGGAQVLFRSDVQTDLGLTDEQKTKLSELRPQRGNRQRGQGGGQGGNGGGQRGQGANREEMAARRAEQQKKIAEILTPEQVKRLKEIQIQLAGPQAILDPEVQKELALDATQTKKVDDLQKGFREANQSVQEKLRNQEIDRTKAAEARKTNNDALKTELQKVLTSAQAEKLKTLGGKPFKADAEGG